MGGGHVCSGGNSGFQVTGMIEWQVWSKLASFIKDFLTCPTPSGPASGPPGVGMAIIGPGGPGYPWGPGRPVSPLLPAAPAEP